MTHRRLNVCDKNHSRHNAVSHASRPDSTEAW